MYALKVNLAPMISASPSQNLRTSLGPAVIRQSGLDALCILLYLTIGKAPLSLQASF